ncbi:MAG TPA: DUF4232 domain-containing protein [Streptosporangiaceae bacterium]|nr:DUF4232 domain-containing protein [Streptosporangiaceae bacterium]
MNKFTPTRRRAVAAALLGCTAVLTAACGSSGSGASPATTVTVTRTPTAPASSPAAAPSSQVPPSSAPAGPPACPNGSLSAKLGLSQGTAGSVYQVIDFTNTSSSTCTLYGYPGVSLAGGSPLRQIGAAATENPATPREVVTLAPGAVANALLQIVDAGNFPPSKCGLVTSTALQIFPPNQTNAIDLQYRSQACSQPVHLLTVNAVRAGSGGSA